MGTEEESLLNELGARQSLLDNDNIPNANQALSCFSCDEPMTGLYCYACGNKNDNYRRSIWSLGVELFQSLTAFEGRIWRSLFSLIIRPGQMARDYADGARQKWTSPIRLFLATSLLLFGYIALSGTQIIVLGDLEKNTGTKQAAIHFGDATENYNQRLLFFARQADLKPIPENPEDITLSSALQDFQTGWSNYTDEEEIIEALDDLIEDAEDEQVRQALLNTRNALAARTSKESSSEGGEAVDTVMTDEELTQAIGKLIEDNDSSVQFSGLDGTQVTLDGNGMARLYDRILRNPEIINNELNTKLKWAMFFMMPFAMFMGALFIRGRETAMLYDHLVHAAYVHSFSFLLLFVFILLSQYTAVPGLLGLYTVLLLLYLPVSAKGAFRRGWFKSILTAYGVGSLYTFTIFVIASVIVIGALQSLAVEFGETRTLNAPTIGVQSIDSPSDAEPDPT